MVLQANKNYVCTANFKAAYKEILDACQSLMSWGKGVSASLWFLCDLFYIMVSNQLWVSNAADPISYCCHVVCCLSLVSLHCGATMCQRLLLVFRAPTHGWCDIDVMVHRRMETGEYDYSTHTHCELCHLRIRLEGKYVSQTLLSNTREYELINVRWYRGYLTLYKKKLMLILTGILTLAINIWFAGVCEDPLLHNDIIY